MIQFLAQVTSQKPLWSGLMYLAGIVVVIGLAAAVLAAIRKSLKVGRSDGESAGLTLSQARDLHARGVISQQEFEQVKQVLVGTSGDQGGSGKARSAL